MEIKFLMERTKPNSLTEMQKELILALHKSELTSRQIAEAAKCAQSTVIRQIQKFQEIGRLPMTERRKATRQRAKHHSLTVTVNDYRTYGMTITPTDEQVNSNQRHFPQFSNMMEVKHSPASKMEFLSNGLADNDVDDIDTLYDDDGTDKSITPPSDECDQNALVLNGIDKDQEELSSSQILDGMGIDVIKDEVDSNDKTVVAEATETNKENEEAEEVKSSDLNDVELELEETPTEKNETDASKVRDTGDDLDTLLSKINDLVEDCIKKPKVGGAAATVVDEIVEIPDDDEMTEASKSKEPEVENNSQVSAEVIVKRSASIEKPPPESKDAPKEQMDIDDDLGDDIVCLDSPLPEDSKLDEDALMMEDDLLNESKEDTPEESEIETEKPAEKEGIPEKEDIATKVDDPQKKEEQAEEKEAAIEEAVESTENDDEQEVFLIDDDDDDDDLINNPEAGEESEQKPEEPKENEQCTEKEIEAALNAICNTPESEQEAKAELEKKVEHEDDDVVCLDDSDKEEETNNETKKDEPTDKATCVENENKESAVENKVEESTDKDKEGADNTKPENSMAEKAVAEIVKEKPVNEVAEKSVEAVADDEPMLEDITKKPDGKEVDSTETQGPKVPSEPEKAESSTKINQNDDIVILDDDEEEDANAAQKDDKTPTSDSDKTSTATTSSEEEKKSAENTSSPIVTITSGETPTVLKPSTIVSDNSDNARDGVEEKSDNKDEPKDAQKEKKTVPSESNSNSSSSNLLKETANQERDEREQPPAKRIRLSQDEASSRHSAISMDDTKSNIVDEDEVMEFKGDEDSKPLKRVHSNDSLAPDFKKPKTDEIVTKDVKKDSTSKDEDVKPEEVKKDEPETKPYELYPLPKFDSPPVAVSLDFLRRYKKKIHKMTRYDMEDFILQKIVEAIVDKSTFAEMREYIEKLEKNVASHRTKLAELTKQFRDLEMVHNRVLKDVETKNSQFIMPVKITRAVGLQVYFPNKKCDQPLAPPSPISTQTSPKNASVSTAVPEKSAAPAPIAPIAPTTSNNSTQPSTVVNNAAAPPQRRGCVQKLTPMRPDTPRNSPLNRSTSTNSQPSPLAAAAKEPVSVVGAPVKILNRGVTTNSRVNPPSNAMAVGNNIPKPTQVPTAAVIPAAVPRPTGTPPGIATKKQIPARNRSSINVPHSSQSDPNLVSQPLPPAATVVASQIPPSMMPKPANKSVIDLTDEDDVVPTPTPPLASPRTPAAAPTPPSASVAANRGPYKVSVIPAQQLQQPRPNPPKQAPGRPPAKLPIIAPKPNGAIIPVRQVPANPARYRHPAPLPNQPVHSSNPAWKLPPARPTIRISNLESGIVISWTIDETAKEKYAESTSYQIYAYQETSGPPLVESWRHVGDVKAMLLPMAVTLTQFQEGQRYYFAVRAMDAHNRCGPFSFAKTWS